MNNELEFKLFENSIFSGNNGKAEEMIKSGIDLNQPGSNGMTPLILAIEGDQPRILELLLKSGANPNKQCGFGDGYAPLHWAVDYAIDGMIQSNKSTPFPEPLECIKILLNHGADAELKNNAGKTALDCALDYTTSKEILNDVLPEEILNKLQTIETDKNGDAFR
ncbi:MAG TPA: ankyrin repeat domain-containing protein [Pyrinomonadaceae bacterium]|jgi:ankyrin repeat protein